MEVGAGEVWAIKALTSFRHLAGWRLLDSREKLPDRLNRSAIREHDFGQMPGNTAVKEERAYPATHTSG